MIDCVGRADGGERGAGDPGNGALLEDGLAARLGGDAAPLSPHGPSARVGFERPEAWGERVLAIDLSPLRYLRDVLLHGLKRALAPKLPVETLRNQRIAAGIELAELDTVPIWAALAAEEDAEEAIAIPFLELVLDEVLIRAEAVLETCAHLTQAGGGRARIAAQEIAALRNRASAAVRSDPSRVHAFPYLPLDDVERVCGRGGAVARLVHECQQLRAEALARCRTLTGPPAGEASR